MVPKGTLMRSFMRYAQSGMVFLLFGLCLFVSHSRTVSAASPNIVMVFIDDMGWGDFSCFGNADATTPAVDQLASEGIRFQQFYVNSPICSPSRVALTTGQYPQRWRINSYLANRDTNTKRGVAQWLDPGAPALPRLLHEAGYRTGHFGKWHMGGQRDVDDAPVIATYGFDESLTNFEGMGAKLLPLTETPGGKIGRIWQDAERLGSPVTWMQRSKITAGFASAALAFIEDAVSQDKPFYINLWPDDVHSPYWPPVEMWKESKRGQYLSVLESMDKQFSKVFDFIRTNKTLRNNTLIIICSDNGPEPGAGSAGPFRGSKATLYEGGIRSPLIAWGPGVLAKTACGRSDADSVFSAMDLVPSLLNIVGIKPSNQVAFDGTDISEALLGEKPRSHQGALCWCRPPDRKMYRPLGNAVLPDLAIRDGSWKLLCDYDGRNAQLFQLQEDPGEQQNMAVAHPEVVSRLTDQLLQWHSDLPSDNGPELGRQQLIKAKVGPANVIGYQCIAADSSKKVLAAVAPDGSIAWEKKCGAIHDLHVLPNGHLLYQDGWTRIIELDQERQKGWEYDATTNGNLQRRVEVHAFQRLPDGNTMIVESGPARILEVDANGMIKHQVPLTVSTSSHHSDTRNARKTDAGTYLVAHEKDGVVREYDPQGNIVWEFDVPLFGRARKGGHGPEAFGDQVYSAVRLDNGNTLIGTGNGHSVLEVTPQKDIVWKLEQDDLPGITLAWVTQVSRLANGNTRLINCHAGPDNPQIIEVTPSKEVVWTFQDFDTFGNALPVAVILNP